MENAIILCSGGLDSVVTAYYVKSLLRYKNLTILFFNYLQRNLISERAASKLCAKNLSADFIELKLPELSRFSTSLLNSSNHAKSLTLKDLKDTIKESFNWYVPFRNTIFLSYALSIAESLSIKNKKNSDIFVGFKNEGGESFPDTTRDYLIKINALAKESSKIPIHITAPLIKKDKEDIVILGNKLSVPLHKTFSCYVSSSKHCGLCLACRLRQEGFYWANTVDKTLYKNKPKDIRLAD